MVTHVSPKNRSRKAASNGDWTGAGSGERAVKRKSIGLKKPRIVCIFRKQGLVKLARMRLVTRLFES